MFGMRKRIFLIEQFLHMLIIIRVFTTHLISLQLYLCILIFFIIAKYFKEGFTPSTFLLGPLILLQVYGQSRENNFIQYLVASLTGIIDFTAFKMYWLPEAKKIVGFRQDSIANNLHYFEFYPLDESENIQIKQLKWNHTNNISKLLKHVGIVNRILNKIGYLLFLSFMDKLSIKIGEGKELKTNSSLIFSHGRGGAPLFNSTFLLHFAGLKFKTAAVQHTELINTGIKGKEQIKIFREKQVQVRAAQHYQAILKAENQRIVLMGHSYGCATVIQAYHSLQTELKKKVTHIILLDPWLFPLSDAKFKQSFQCPVLILANEYFVDHIDMHTRNTQFLRLHNVEYVLWKNGDHLHQSDMGFILGNILGMVKNHHLSHLMLDLNLQAIDKFFKGEKVEGTFGDQDLGREYRPQKFRQTGFNF